MKPEHSLRHSSRSYRSWISAKECIKCSRLEYACFRAGILLTTACLLFILSHIYIRWSTFPFKYRNIGSVYSGLWRRNVFFGSRSITFKIKCTHERKPCAKLIIARIFMIITCIASGIGGIALCILPTVRTRYKSILYILGLSLAFASFVFGILGFLFGISWIIQFENDTIGSAAICALIASFLALISAICAFFINSNEPM